MGGLSLSQPGFQSRSDFSVKKLVQPEAAGRQVRGGGRILRGEGFQQSEAAHWKTSSKEMVSALADNELGAAAADIKNKKLLSVQFRVGGDSAEDPVGLLIAGDDFQRQPRRLIDGEGQLIFVQGVARGTCPNDANGASLGLAGEL